MIDPDVRWKQRFDSYKRALSQFTKFMDKGELNDLEEQGLIQAFEYTHESAWKLLKEFLSDRGTQNMYGSKDVTRVAFSLGLIEDGDIWMDMIRDRNRTSHTYNRETAKEIAHSITNRYFRLFVALRTKMEEFSDADT